MTKDNTGDASLSGIARVAGFLFLFTFIFPTINFFLLSKFMVAENAIATAHNILANESVFRIGIFNEVVISLGAIVFALALFILLKSVNRIFALLALFLKLTEAILFAVVALGHFVALLTLKERASLAVFGPEQIQAYFCYQAIAQRMNQRARSGTSYSPQSRSQSRRFFILFPAS